MCLHVFMCICIYLCLCICACVFDRWLEELPPGAALNWILSLLFLGPFRLHELQVNLHGLRSLFHTLLGNSLLCPVLYIFRIPQSFWSVNTSSSIFSSWYTFPLPNPFLFIHHHHFPWAHVGLNIGVTLSIFSIIYFLKTDLKTRKFYKHV